MNLRYIGYVFSVKGIVFILFFFVFVMFGIFVKYFFKGGFLLKVVFFVENDIMDVVVEEWNINDGIINDVEFILLML